MSRNLKLKYRRNKLITKKCPVFWKTQPNLFQNCEYLNTRQGTVFKPNCVQRFVSLNKNSNKTSSKGKERHRNAFFVQKFENTESNKQATRIVSLYKNSKKTSSKISQSQRNAVIIQKFENTEPEKQANSVQILCTVQGVTKSLSKLRKLEHWKKNSFQTYICLNNCFFV